MSENYFLFPLNGYTIYCTFSIDSQGPVVRKRDNINPGLGETSNFFVIKEKVIIWY